jgi:hypothetical protein
MKIGKFSSPRHIRKAVSGSQLMAKLARARNFVVPNVAPRYANSPPAAASAIPGRRRVNAYTVSAPPPSNIPHRCSVSACDPPSRALRLISVSLDISVLLV